MYVVTVTIGRNIRTRPMTDTQWSAFKNVVGRTVCYVRIPERYETHTGTAEREGVPEESWKIAAFYPEPWVLRNKNDLAFFLAEAAREYKQDAITVSYGESELVLSATH